MPLRMAHDEIFLARVRETLRRLPVSGTLLDVGAGDGWLTRCMVNRGLTVTAVEPFDTPEWFREFTKAEPSDLPFPDRSFDHVTCFQCLEHVLDVEKTIAELARVTRGHAYITVPVLDRVLCPSHKRQFSRVALQRLLPGAAIEEMRVGLPRKYFWANWSCS